MDLQRNERHCYKCDGYRIEAGGAMCRDGRGRKRFVCVSCLTYVPSQTIVSLFTPALSAQRIKAADTLRKEHAAGP